MGLLERAMQRLDQAVRANGQTVTYVDGDDSVTLTALPAKSTMTIVDAGGAAVRVDRTDWLISAADLVLGGYARTPREGAYIRHTVGAWTYVYRVCRRDDQAAWEYLNAWQQTYRVRVTLENSE